MTKGITSTHPMYDMIIEGVSQISQGKSYLEIKAEMHNEGLDTKTINKVIRAMQKYIQDREMQGTIIYHTTHLSRLSNLYDQLYQAKLFDKAHKVLQDHKSCYVYLTALLED